MEVKSDFCIRKACIELHFDISLPKSWTIQNKKCLKISWHNLNIPHEILKFFIIRLTLFMYKSY